MKDKFCYSLFQVFSRYEIEGNKERILLTVSREKGLLLLMLELKAGNHRSFFWELIINLPKP